MAIPSAYLRFVATDYSWMSDIGGTAYRYVFGVKEIQAFESTDATGTDALASATALASSYKQADQAPQYSHDGDTTTLWAADYNNVSTFQWLSFSLGATKTVQSVKVLFKYGNWGSQAPKSIDVQAFVSSTWETIASIEPENANEWQTFSLISGPSLAAFFHLYQRKLEGN